MSDNPDIIQHSSSKTQPDGTTVHTQGTIIHDSGAALQGFEAGIAADLADGYYDGDEKPKRGQAKRSPALASNQRFVWMALLLMLMFLLSGLVWLFAPSPLAPAADEGACSRPASAENAAGNVLPDLSQPLFADPFAPQAQVNPLTEPTLGAKCE